MLIDKKHDESLNRLVYLETVNAKRVFFFFFLVLLYFYFRIEILAVME